MIYLHVSKNEKGLTILISEDNKDPFRKEVHVSMKKVNELCDRMILILNENTRTGDKDISILKELKEKCHGLSFELLPSEIKDELRHTTSPNLLLTLDSSLAHIPWELLWIDEIGFLCDKFVTGRMIAAEQKFRKSSDDNEKPYRMWILADQTLEYAVSEGVAICKEMDAFSTKKMIMKATMDTQITAEDFKHKIMGYQFIHFAGHGIYDPELPEKCGWQMDNNTCFTVQDLTKMIGTAKMPFMVFSNACQSSSIGLWKNLSNVPKDFFGLANAFRLAGVQHYIGTFRKIPDNELSIGYARKFYEYLITGETIGESLRLARQSLKAEHPESVAWASYVLYGDPTKQYFQKDENLPLPTNDKSDKQTMIKGTIPEITQDRTSEHVAKGFFLTLGRKAKILLICLAFSILISIGYFLIPQPEDNWTSKVLPLAVKVHKSIAEYLDQRMDIFTATVIESQILKYPRIKLVDRIFYDDIKNEQEEWNSTFMNQKQNIKPSTYKAEIYLDIFVDKLTVHMRLKSTKTSQVTEIFNEPLENNKLVLSQKEKLSRNLLEVLRTHYPIQGVITGIEENKIFLNIGNDVGVVPSTRFTVVGKDIELEMIQDSIKPDISIAKVIGQKYPQKGDKIISNSLLPEKTP